MKPAVALLLLTIAVAVAQTPPAANLLTLPPDTVVATLDGQKVRAADVQVVLRAIPPQQQEASLKSPQTFLEQYGLMRRLSGMAEKAGLDQKSPIKEQIAYNRMLALAQAQLAATQDGISVKPDEVEKYYTTNKDNYTQARLKVIYIPFSAQPPSQPSASDKKVLSEADAKASVDKLYAQLQAGADFVKLVKENSGDAASVAKDGDFGTFRRSDQIPDEIKNAVFALKAGQVTQPMRQPNGFYIFRLEELTTQPLDEVRGQISLDLTSARMSEWVADLKKSIEVKLEPQAGTPPAPAPAPAK